MFQEAGNQGRSGQGSIHAVAVAGQAARCPCWKGPWGWAGRAGPRGAQAGVFCPVCTHRPPLQTPPAAHRLCPEGWRTQKSQSGATAPARPRRVQAELCHPSHLGLNLPRPWAPGCTLGTPLPSQGAGQGQAERGEEEQAPHGVARWLCPRRQRRGAALIPTVPTPIRALPESTPGSGTPNESLATAQARLSGRSGVTFAFLGEDGVGGAVGAEQGLVWLILGQRRSRRGSRTGSPSQHQPLIHRWKPPKMLQGNISLLLHPTGTCPWPWGAPSPGSCREVQERDVFVPSGQPPTSF